MNTTPKASDECAGLKYLFVLPSFFNPGIFLLFAMRFPRCAARREWFREMKALRMPVFL